MKYSIHLVIVAVLAIGFYYGAPFYRGIKPAFFPAEDITKNIETPPDDVIRISDKDTVPITAPPDGRLEVPAQTPHVSGIRDESKELGLSIPAGFAIQIYAKDLISPRVIAFDALGLMHVSITSGGRIISIKDANGDGYAEEKKIILSGLKKPHGIVFFEEHMYVAEEHRVVRYRYDSKNGKIIDADGEKIADLPTDGGGHFTRTLLVSNIGGRDELYATVGSSCNVCYEKDPRRASVLVMDFDGSNQRIFARGLRNAVFMVSHPDGKQIAVTEMGRDWLGDFLPLEEINYLATEGQNFGWPVCYGDKVNDRDFDKNIYIRDPCMDTEAPAFTMPAHSAPLGLAFLDTRWGSEFEGDLLVAQHGSWNKTDPIGYKVVRFEKANGLYNKVQQNFITGWLRDGNAVGRPADIILEPGGIGVFISDDKAGVIYRIVKK